MSNLVTVLTELSQLQVCVIRLSHSIFPSTLYVIQFQFNGTLGKENLSTKALSFAKCLKIRSFRFLQFETRDL
jgi:hypothetical protein